MKISNYYKYPFESPEPLYAKIKLELKSYFDTGAVDDLLFPVYIKYCLDKLGRLSYDIKESTLFIENSVGRLPDDFKYVREVWMCSEYNEIVYPSASSIYQQITPTTKAFISSRIDTADVYCDVCNECQFPDSIKAVYKTTEETLFTFRKSFLLSPANINTACPSQFYCANERIFHENKYDVHGNKLVTTARNGIVYLIYYSEDESNIMIPVDERGYFKKWMELYIKSQVFEQLFNQTTDETFNQSERKYLMYKQQADEAYILARNESISEDVYRKRRATRRTQRRNLKYEI